MATTRHGPHYNCVAPALLPVLASPRRILLAQARVPVPHNYFWITAIFILFPRRRDRSSGNSAGRDVTRIRISVSTFPPIRTAPSLILRTASATDEARPHFTSTLSNRI